MNPFECKEIYNGLLDTIESCPRCNKYLGQDLNNNCINIPEDDINKIICLNCNHEFFIKNLNEQIKRSREYVYNPKQQSSRIYYESFPDDTSESNDSTTNESVSNISTDEPLPTDNGISESNKYESNTRSVFSEYDSFNTDESINN